MMCEDDAATEIANSFSESMNACATLASAKWQGQRVAILDAVSWFVEAAPLIDLPSVEGPKDILRRAGEIAAKLQPAVSAWDGVTDPPDELLKLTNPELVAFQMDCGWVFASGHDPVQFLKKTPKRFPLLHVKDMVMQPDGKEKITVLGKGSIDYGPILKAATAAKYFYVEQEEYDMEVFEELRLDAEYMRHLQV